jgi:hypothetical protein
MMRRGRAVRYLVDFDSGVNMVGELGRFGEGKNYRGLSMGRGHGAWPTSRRRCRHGSGAAPSR